MASDKLSGKRVAFLVAPEGIEQVELTEPWKAVEAAGGSPELLSTDSGEVQAFNHLDKADTFTVDRTVAEADASDYDGLVLPGGVANPDFLRTDEDAVAFVRAFFEQAKPVAAICHAPWTLIEADVVEGRTLTSWPSLQTDLRNAGANWVDEEVVVDQGLVTSRKPDDLAGVLRQGRRGDLRGRARRAGAQRVMAGAGRDPRRRRHARRHELPARARVVPGVPPARRGAADLAHPPPHRDGRRPAGRLPGLGGVRRGARRRRPRRREGALPVADRRGPAAGGRARADRGPARARPRRRAGRPPRRRRRSTTTSTCSTRASSSTAGRPRPTSSGPSRSPTSSPRRSRRRAAATP